MRPHSVGEFAALTGTQPQHQLRVEVQHGDGAWVDRTSSVVGLNWGEERDRPHATASIQFHRSIGTRSLAPTMAASLRNRMAADGSFTPALDVGRAIRILTTVGPDGEREVFTGRIDSVAWEADPVRVECSDLGGWLLDTQIEDEADYGSPGGTLLETVMQSILNAWPSGATSVPALYTPVSPAYYRTTFTQDRVKVLEALRTLALNIGWDVRYRYDATHTSRLTLMDPDRDRVDVDATFPRVLDISRLSLAIETIRNAGVVEYRDGTTGDFEAATAEDPASISQHGRRWFLIGPQEGIDTLSEAQALVDAAVADMAGPGAAKTIQLLYFWPVQLFDRYTVPGDDLRFDEPQTLAVAGYRHEWQGGAIQTTITGTTRLVGAYLAWRRRIVDLVPEESGPALDVIATPGATHYSIAYAAASPVELSIDGAAYAAAPASPILVARPAAGAPAKSYAFRVTVGEEVVSNEITVPAIDQDTVTPDLSVVPGAMADTTYTFAIAATNPAGGAAPTILVTFRGTTGTINGTPVAADTPTAAPSGATVVADRPPFGTTTQASVTFAASIAGGGAEIIQRTILNQVKTSFGPTLEVTPTPGDASYSIAYTSNGSVTVSINGGAFGAPAASPTLVSRTASDQVYVFKATLDGQTITQEVTVPALPGAGTEPVGIGTPTISVDDINDEFDVTWPSSPLPAGGSFRFVWEDTDANVGYRNSAFTTSGNALSLTSGADHGYPTIAPGFTHTIRGYVEARNASGIIVGRSPVGEQVFSHT